MQHPHAAMPRRQLFRASKWFIYVTVNLAVFIDAYLYGLVIPVLPFALTEYVHLPPASVQKWIGVLLGAFGAGLLVGSPVAGYLADNSKSRRATYMFGLISLAASTVMLSVGHSIWIMGIARFIQGTSSAFVHCVGVAILSDTVGEAGIGPAMGFITMMIALGMVFGPMCGGFIYHRFGYQAVFVSAYALIGIDLLFRILMLEQKNDRSKPPSISGDDSHRNRLVKSDHIQEDYGTMRGQHQPNALHGVGTIFADSDTDSSSSLSSPDTFSSSSDSDSLLTAQYDPKPPPSTHQSAFISLLRNRRMLAAILGSLTESFVLTELESTLPLYIKRLFAYNSSQVGLIFLTLSLPSFTAPLIGALSDRYAPKAVISLGYLLLSPILICLRLVNHDSPAQVALLCILLFAIGVALNMILTPVFAEAKAAVDDLQEEDPRVFGDNGAYAQAFAMMNMAYAAGSLVGPLLGGVVVERIGWGNLMLGTGVLSLVCVGPVLYGSGGKREKAAGLDEGVGY